MFYDKCTFEHNQLVITFSYAIPTDKRIRQIWLDRIENRLLYGRDNLQNYRVCVRHFNHICLEDNNKLKKYALPTLSLPGNNIV